MHAYIPIIHVLHSICKACDNLRMRGRGRGAYVEKRAKYFKRRTHYNAWQLHLDICFKPWLPYGF